MTLHNEALHLTIIFPLKFIIQMSYQHLLFKLSFINNLFPLLIKCPAVQIPKGFNSVPSGYLLYDHAMCRIMGLGGFYVNQSSVLLIK